jgi:hypothetical protein
MQKIDYKVGEQITARGQLLTIVKVHPFGTLDVKAANGKHYRITGLPVYRFTEGK